MVADNHLLLSVEKNCDHDIVSDPRICIGYVYIQ